MNQFNLRLDLDKGTNPRQVVRIRQGDELGTTIAAAIFDHGTLVTTAPNACHITMRLPDGTHYYRKAATWADGTATVTIDETQAASAVGRTLLAYFTLTVGDAQYSTGAFAVVVEPDAVGDAELPEDYDTAIQEAIDRCNAAAAALEGALPIGTANIANGAVTADKLADAVRKGNVRSFDTVAAMQAATDLLAGMTCHTNGFHASGDGGAAYYTVSASGTANGMDVLALQGGLFATLVVVGYSINAKMFGCVGDGISDDTSKLQAMLDYGIYDVYLNSGTYLVSDTLEVNRPRYFHGAGTTSRIMVNADFDTSASIVQIAATERTVAHESSYHLDNFAIVPSDFSTNSSGSGTIGGIGIECLVSQSNGTYTAFFQNNLVIENMYIGRLANVGIFMNNENSNNGFFSCIIKNNNINSGFKTNRFGDGNTIRDNFFQGVGEIYLDGISGATTSTSFTHNVVTCGCIHLANGARNFIISENQIELINKTGLTQVAAIVVESSFTKIINNSINCNGSGIDCMRFITAYRCCAYDNLCVCDSSNYWIYNDQSGVVRANGNYPSTSSGGINVSNLYYTTEREVITGVYKAMTLAENDYVRGSIGFILYDDGMLNIHFNLTALQNVSTYVTIPTPLHSYISKKASGNIGCILYCGADNVRVDFQGYNMSIGGNENSLPSGHSIKGNAICECIPF